MRKRSRLEIYLDVLEAVSKVGKLTHIGNLANLSWKDTVKHLGFLELNGFVKRNKRKDGSEEYILTQKGLEALNTLRKITEALTFKVEVYNE